MNSQVVSIDKLKTDIVKAVEILTGVVTDIQGKVIVQTVSTPEPPKKVKRAGKKRGRKPGQKNKKAEAPPASSAA